MPRSKRWPFFSGSQCPPNRPCARKMETPCIFRITKLGGSIDRRVGFVDLAPTLLSIAGKKPPAHMQGHAFMGKYETTEQEYGYGFRGRMDERYDMVRSVLVNVISTSAIICPTNLYGQHVSYMFQTTTTQVWKKLFDEGKLNSTKSLLENQTT